MYMQMEASNSEMSNSINNKLTDSINSGALNKALQAAVSTHIQIAYVCMYVLNDSINSTKLCMQ